MSREGEKFRKILTNGLEELPYRLEITSPFRASELKLVTSKAEDAALKGRSPTQAP